MITREFPPISGGIGYYVYYLSKKLIEKGHDITVITRGIANKSKKELVDGIEVIKASFFPFYPLHVWIHGAFVNRLIKSIESKLTLVHMHTPLPPPIKTSLPILTTVHTAMKTDARYHEVFDFYSLAERMQSMIVTPPIESKIFKLSSKITSVSQTVAEELRDYGINPNDITVIGNGVDEKVFFPLKTKMCHERYILYTGMLRARKGLLDLIKCGEIICNEYPDIKFLICGKGPFGKFLEENIRNRGLENQIILLGHVDRDELIKYYQNATIHIVPSHYEGLPTVLLEAMSCGLPVIATDIGGNNEVISSGTNGFLVPKKAPKEMAKVVSILLEDDLLRSKIGQSARKTIEKKYTWDKIAEKSLLLYNKLV